jgi:hypothetical protein
MCDALPADAASAAIERAGGGNGLPCIGNASPPRAHAGHGARDVHLIGHPARALERQKFDASAWHGNCS